ncbi:MAG: DUF1080 domain-containing protein [Acidobacteriia bacterium]|nr:DUF1080 domain-containing protein [Terriglobia bacterium]
MARTVCCFPLFGVALIGVISGRAAGISLTDMSRFDLMNAQVETTTYHGRKALKMTEKEAAPGNAFAILKDVPFHDGVIELEVSGAPSKTADPTARGFIGILFRMKEGGSQAECFYLRPSNGRAGDQLARNYSVQYVSPPEWSWRRLREETPGQYESYADMQPGEWTRMRIVVHGKEAALYVGGAQQPCLIVKDMKRGDSQGAVALWIGPGTEGYFRELTITPASTGKGPH